MKKLKKKRRGKRRRKRLIRLRERLGQQKREGLTSILIMPEKKLQISLKQIKVQVPPVERKMQIHLLQPFQVLEED